MRRILLAVVGAVLIVSGWVDFNRLLRRDELADHEVPRGTYAKTFIVP